MSAVKRMYERQSLPRWAQLALWAIATANAAGMGFACSSDAEPPPPTSRPRTMPGPPTEAICPTTPTVTYANFGRALMQKYCLTCHSEKLGETMRRAAPLNVNFDTVDMVRHHTVLIDKTTAFGPRSMNKSMPPAPPDPTDDERRKLGEWLACGAPQ